MILRSISVSRDRCRSSPPPVGLPISLSQIIVRGVGAGTVLIGCREICQQSRSNVESQLDFI